MLFPQPTIPPYTHTDFKERYEDTHSRMQEISSIMETFPWEEYRNQKNRLTPVKLESKKQAKTVTVVLEGFGWEVPIFWNLRNIISKSMQKVLVDYKFLTNHIEKIK